MGLTDRFKPRPTVLGCQPITMHAPSLMGGVDYGDIFIAVTAKHLLVLYIYFPSLLYKLFETATVILFQVPGTFP